MTTELINKLAALAEENGRLKATIESMEPKTRGRVHAGDTLSVLPDEFWAADVAGECGISATAARGRIQRALKAGCIERVRYGLYRKVDNDN